MQVFVTASGRSRKRAGFGSLHRALRTHRRITATICQAQLPHLAQSSPPRRRRPKHASAEGMLDISKLHQVVAYSIKSPVGTCLATRQFRGYDGGDWSMMEPNRFSYCAERPK